MAKILSSVVVAVTVALLAVCAGLVAADVDENQRPRACCATPIQPVLAPPVAC